MTGDSTTLTSPEVELEENNIPHATHVTSPPGNAATALQPKSILKTNARASHDLANGYNQEQVC